MTLSTEQIAQITAWADAGADLNTIQKKLTEEMSMHLTYMDTRFLILDLGITIQTPQPPAKKETPQAEANASTPEAKLNITVDQVMTPGYLLSGKVSFASGASGSWLLDQTGRLSWEPIIGEPNPEDLEVFQKELTRVIKSHMGTI